MQIARGGIDEHPGHGIPPIPAQRGRGVVAQMNGCVGGTQFDMVSTVCDKAGVPASASTPVAAQSAASL
jgi:hypothetical protein